MQHSSEVAEAAPILWSLGDIDDYATAEVVCMSPPPTAPVEIVHVTDVDFSFNDAYNTGRYSREETVQPKRPPKTNSFLHLVHHNNNSSLNSLSNINFSPSSTKGEYVVPKLLQLTETFILYENERCAPLVGWSAQNLKTTDCKRISLDGGYDCWDNTQQASIGLLSYGWQWIENGAWALNSAHPWIYAESFVELERGLGSLKKSSQHKVRRRQFKEPTKEFATLTCDHCDLTEVTKISSLLLEYFVDISLLMFPTVNQQMSVTNAMKIKTALVPIKQPTSNQYSRVNYQAFLFAWKQQLVKSNPAITWAPTAHEQREAEAKKIFSVYERMELARNILRVHDRLNHSFHCASDECGRDCEFAVYLCPRGCGVKYSYKWRAEHAHVCAMRDVALPSAPPPVSTTRCTSPAATVSSTGSSTINNTAVPISSSVVYSSSSISSISPPPPPHSVNSIDSNSSTAINSINNLSTSIAGGLRRVSSSGVSKMEKFSLFPSSAALRSPPIVDESPAVRSRVVSPPPVSELTRCRYCDIGCKIVFSASDGLNTQEEEHYQLNAQHHLALAMLKIAADKRTIDDMCEVIERLGGEGI